MRWLKRKVCLVTGGASGLGRQAAIMLAQEGNSVVIGDTNAEGGHEAVRLIEAEGGQAHFHRTDVSRSEDVQALVGLAVEKFGGLDCAVNCAGIEGPRASIADYAEEDWIKLIGINLIGVFLCLKYQIPQMVARGGGSIVNVGSTASLSGMPRMSAYSSAKNALVGLTKTAALEYGDRQVRVNIVCPGSFHTPMSDRLYGADLESIIVGRTPLRRVGGLSEIGDSIVWLCSDSSTFVTGAVVSVDGGRVAGPMANPTM